MDAMISARATNVATISGMLASSRMSLSMGRKGKKSGDGLQYFQVNTLLGISANDPKQRAKCFDGLTAFADELPHIPFAHLYREQDSKLVNLRINEKLLRI